MKKNAISIFRADTSSSEPLPFANEGVKAGFPSPAQDYLDLTIDLNKEVVRNPSSTFYARVNGDSMQDERIFDGDILVIDKSLAPKEGDKVICYVDGEFNVKFVEIDKENEIVWLVSANPNYPKIKVTPDNDFIIWGVVTYTFTKHRK